VKVVGIGGGHGLAASLRAARLYSDDVSAVVTVADDGGSSGRLTRELGVPPPGDIRNCLVALSENEELSELWQHRFTSGALTGHTVGNLVIAALTERAGDFALAVEAAGRLLSVRGHVYPATTERVAMRARVEGGVVKGQVAVAQSRSPIQAVYLKPSDPSAHPPAVAAIEAADQILLGPGSLFTSLIATLLVPGIGKALRDANARRIFICNSRMQKGETEGLSAAAHVEALLAHVGPFTVDTVVVQAPVVAEDGVKVDSEALDFLNIDVVPADVARADGGHVPEHLAEVLSKLV
jgi:uncharacterized cofD-like protein